MAAAEAFAGAADAGASVDNAQAAAERAAENALQGLGDLYEQTYSRVLPRFAQRAYDALQDGRSVRRDPTTDIWLVAVRRFLSREAGALIARVSSTVLGRVREVLDKQVTAGKGIAEIARAFRKAIPSLSRERATVWARTETLRASNLGAMEGARASGLTLEKVWLATPDGRTRDTHADANEQRRPLEQPFDIGGYAAMQPGDASLPASESINCRCTVVFEPLE